MYAAFQELQESIVAGISIANFLFLGREAPSWDPPTRLGITECTRALELGAMPHE